MVTAASLLATPAVDVTYERVRDLVEISGNESLTLEFKERYSPKLIESVAALANSYGGTIIVGVREGKGRIDS